MGIDPKQLTKKECNSLIERLMTRNKMCLKAIRVLKQQVQDLQNRLSNDDLMVDLNAPKVLDIEFSTDYQTLWVNADGACKLRAQNIQKYNVTLPGHKFVCNEMEFNCESKDDES